MERFRLVHLWSRRRPHTIELLHADVVIGYSLLHRLYFSHCQIGHLLFLDTHALLPLGWPRDPFRIVFNCGFSMVHPHAV